MRYEQLVQFVNELPRTEFFSDPEIGRLYRLGVGKYNVTEELLGRLEGEHEQVRRMSKEYKNIGFSLAVPHKHYIRNGERVVAVCLPANK